MLGAETLGEVASFVHVSQYLISSSLAFTSGNLSFAPPIVPMDLKIEAGGS